MPNRPVPRPTPETATFWEGARRHELRLQRCRPNGHVYFFPRPFCPTCSSTDVEWFPATGKGTLHSYVINHRPAHGFSDMTPYVIAVVQLDEGPRMMTNIVGVEPLPANLPPDLPVEVVWEPLDEIITLPLFRPRSESAA
jgi:uncharacterized OB-fold protein